MDKINGGILTNAKPLSKEQIKELENDVLNSNKTYAYLDENNNICFMMSHSARGIKDLAWNDATEVKSEESALTKNVYQKTNIDSYKLTKSFRKEPAESEWTEKEVYSIVTALSNCYGSNTNPTEIVEGTTTSLYFHVAGRYTFPTQVDVVGATYEWNFSSGELIISNPTDTVYISISCNLAEGFVPSAGNKPAPEI